MADQRQYWAEYGRENRQRRNAQARRRYATNEVQRERIKVAARERKARDPIRAARRKAWAEHRAGTAERRRAKDRRLNRLRRARTRGAEVVDHVDPAALLERDAGRCGICGGEVDQRDFHVDHVVPISAGGAHSYANTQVAHPSCNLRKGNRGD